MLGAIGLVFARDGNETALAFTFAALAGGTFLVSYTRARAEALGLKGDVGLASRTERVILIVIGLVVAPWGGLRWASTSRGHRLLTVATRLVRAQPASTTRQQHPHGLDC